MGFRQDRLLRLPAAAAGSAAKAFGPTLSAAAGLIDLVGASGLLLLCVPDSLRDGDRDRRSKRDERFGSGSVWSNRDRLELLLSSSAIVRVFGGDRFLSVLKKVDLWHGLENRQVTVPRLATFYKRD